MTTNNAKDAKDAKQARTGKMLDKTLDALPMTGAAIGLIVLVCVFSGTLREILLRADLDLLAAAVALLPLAAALAALGLGMRTRKHRTPAARTRLAPREVMRRKAMLHATYDLNDQP